jgi:regulator of protease activity HflC (stomatin/prohibitin superfamily)
MLDQLLNVISIIAWIWFALFVVLVTIRAYQHTGGQGAVKALLSVRVFVALIIVVGISLMSASLVFIEPQNVGVVISLLSPDGYRENPQRSGLHLIFPLAERVVLYPISWQTYTMSTEPLEGAKVGDDSIAARTSDGQAVYIDCSVIYRIDANEAIRVHIDFQNRYIEDYIRPVLRGVVRTEVSQFTADEVNSSKRKNLETNLQELLTEAFGEKGFVLDRFLLRNIAFSEEYAKAIELKQVAEQDRIQREYQAEQVRTLAAGQRDKYKIEAQGKADATVLQAEADAKATLLKADAESKALKLIADALKADKDLITYRYIEKLAPGVRVMLVPNDNPYLLPLPDLSGELAPTPGTDGSILPPTPLLTDTITSTLGITSTFGIP